jgi:adenosine deaminase
MTFHPDPRLRAFLRRLPKTETHLHIEGALPWEMLNTLDPGRFPSPPASWHNDYRFPDFARFERELLDMAMAWYTSPERYHEAARVILQRLHEEEGVRYVETSFASGMIEFLGLEARPVAEAIKQAAPPAMEVRVYMGIHHDGYTERSRSFIEASLGWDEVDGIDLHGTETTPLEPWTADLWGRARAAGKRTKAHAGEFAGPAFVERVMDELGVRRIQHGTRAVESAKLVRRLREEGAVLDMCPISNLKLRVVPSLAEHPIRRLYDEGVVVTVNTDDPLSFGNTLTEEYTVLHQELGFSYAELGEVAANGFRNAQADAAWIESCIEEIATAVSESDGRGQPGS